MTKGPVKDGPKKSDP